MLDTKKPQADQFTRTITFAAIVAAVAIVSVVLLFGSVTSPGQSEANASSAALNVPDQIASPEENRAFISRGHDRAAREGDATPLPPTF
jgi:hypothetical protein